MVECVEGLEPELQRRVLAEVKFLNRPRSRLLMPGAPQDAAARVAEGAQRRLGEGGSVEPLVDRSAAGMDVPDDVRPVGSEGVEDASRGRPPRS